MPIQVDTSEAQQGIQSLQDGLKQAITDALHEMAESAISGAQSSVPVDTGELHDSIQILDEGENYIDVGSDVEHAAPVEFGTYKMSPQPYLGPEADRMQSEAPSILLRHVEQNASG